MSRRSSHSRPSLRKYLLAHSFHDLPYTARIVSPLVFVRFKRTFYFWKSFEGTIFRFDKISNRLWIFPKISNLALRIISDLLNLPSVPVVYIRALILKQVLDVRKIKCPSAIVDFRRFIYE